jgi:hypothetical protein
MLTMSVAAAAFAALAPTADAVAMVTALSKCESARLNSLGGRSRPHRDRRLAEALPSSVYA